MTEHRGTSFFHSCVKMPVDPCSRQPTPSYERPRLSSRGQRSKEKVKRINFVEGEPPAVEDSESSSPRDTLENFLEFLKSIPDYGQVHHLSNEQFKQQLEYLKRKQRLLLQNLKNSLDDTEKPSSRLSFARNESSKSKNEIKSDHLKLSGKKCYLEESRTSSPILFPCGTFAGLAEDQDLLTYRCRDKDKETKTMRNKEILAANKSWSTWSGSKSDDSVDSEDGEDSIETKSLPPSSSKEWHPTVPKPFSFMLREEAEKYMAEIETAECAKQDNEKKSPSKKRRVRPIPITSKIPLYDKLMAEKEERSRIVREESALNLLSQVRPFKLECDRRAWRSLARSSPELRSASKSSCSSRFKAKPVPRNLFGTEVYDRMLEDEYYRQLRKRVRAAELLKSSSLPPSMARRERVKSACSFLQDAASKDEDDEPVVTPATTATTSDRVRSAMTSLMSSRGNNLAAILRCQASREKLEHEIRERMEEKRREQLLKVRETLIGRKPAWRALRSAARHEHDRDLDLRTSLRRDEAREQAERHRLHMEMMLDRVTQIPTLFERHSQSFQSLAKAQQQKTSSKSARKKKKKKKKKQQQPKRSTSSSLDSYLSFASNYRPNSGSLISSSGTLASSSQSSSKSSHDSSDKSVTTKSETSTLKRKTDRGPLKVSINETAELIEDRNEKSFSSDERSRSEEHEDAL
ncbi:protein FAM161A [Linepithema humile]|uniref:protein FAM161A n=1 Tax=Linepithema humile TaxID=83485 RepID=UPI00062365E0|nr:PREDICTED: protein FAM161A [Linepithema humile]XP_012231038.1 PREDICTED: protein FAM161A [Linepithema humile]